MTNDRGFSVGGHVYATEYAADAAWPTGVLFANHEYTVAELRDNGGMLKVEGLDDEFPQLFFTLSPTPTES